MTADEALEYFEFNIQGSYMDQGESNVRLSRKNYSRSDALRDTERAQ